MRRTGIISLIAVTLGAGFATAGESVRWSYGDILVTAAGEPNDPNGQKSAPGVGAGQPWDPATHVAATWESLTLMSKLYNPAEKPNAKVPDRSLSLAGRVDVIDVNGLIGFDSATTGTLVLDEKAAAVYSGKPIPSHYCHFYWPLRYMKKMSTIGQWVSELQPYNVTVSMPMDPNRPYPLVLSKVEWSMYALAAGEVKTVDVPFRPTTDWITLAPGLEIKVEKITADSNRYEYRLATRYNHSKVEWTTGGAIALWTQDPTPEVILTKLDVLDPQGKSIPDQGNGSFSSSASAGGSGDLMTGTASGSGNCDICGTATTFRFTLALKPVQQELRFTLENVPVPLP